MRQDQGGGSRADKEVECRKLREAETMLTRRQ